MKWGLIGASNIAKEWMIDAIRSQGGKIEYVMSSNAERGVEFAKQNNIPNSTTNINELLSNVDAVYISTTNNLHYEQTKKAVLDGKYVICEKPFVMDLDEAKDLISIQHLQRPILVNHHFRNQMTIRKAKRLYENDEIGELLSIRIFKAVGLPGFLQGWRVGSKELGGGVIYDITTHNSDTVNFVTGLTAQSVMSMGQITDMVHSKAPVEDGVISAVTYKGGIVGVSHESYTHFYANNGLELHGKKGSIVVRQCMGADTTGTVELRNSKGTTIFDVVHKNLYEPNVKAIYELEKFGNGYLLDKCNAIDGAKALAQALAVKESMNTGKLVLVKDVA